MSRKPFTHTSLPDSSAHRYDDELNLEGLGGAAPIDPSLLDDVFDDNDCKPPATKPSANATNPSDDYSHLDLRVSETGDCVHREALYPSYTDTAQNTRLPPSWAPPPLMNTAASSATMASGYTFETMQSDRLRLILSEQASGSPPYGQPMRSMNCAVPNAAPMWNQRSEDYAHFGTQPQQMIRQFEQQHQHMLFQPQHLRHPNERRYSDFQPLPLDWSPPSHATLPPNDTPANESLSFNRLYQSQNMAYPLPFAHAGPTSVPPMASRHQFYDPLAPPPAPVDVSVAAAVAAFHQPNVGESTEEASLSTSAHDAISTSAQSSPRKRRAKRNDDPNAPIKNLTAYNFFFRFERDRLLQYSRSELTIDAPEDLPAAYFDYHAWTPDTTEAEQREILQSQWTRDRSVKRKHTKSHGRISFQCLTQRIARSWNALPQAVKDVFRDVALKDAHRYAREQNKYDKEQEK